MSPPTKKDLQKGAATSYGYQPADENFLKPDDPDGNWTASASGHGYNARFDDDSGHVRGANWDDTNDHGLRNKLADEHLDGVYERLASLIDDAPDMGSGNALLGGGGPVSELADDDSAGWKGSGRKGPRYAPKDTRGLSGNMKGWKK